MEKIVEIGLERLKGSKREPFDFTPDKKTNDLLNDIENYPHVYVLGCLMDRQIKAEKAWAIPKIVFDLLNTYDINELEKIEIEEYQTLFVEKNLHRFNKDMAEVFYKAIQDINSKYNGDASKIWQSEPSSALAVYRFLEFKGCGIKIATMATNLLARIFKIKFSDYYSIDISPDVHIKRVLARMGYVPHDPSSEMVIYKARELNPEYPGIIDLSCWEIGKNWCKPTSPDCSNCIINNYCKRIIQT